ncbi:TetR family transcriptional regulator [Clostridium bornimense]|uniref:TetR family transcriptional regulator n=1 Tax=Clostridium bornimense TaxID=1216932 RepID=W6RUT4_9CLOT|nr:TetR/AcrR family transcriptional regulator [Clostridium bornimense]CDM68411.1 TetR family transcriptional regulator [Clostridium bornimense]
MNKNSEETKERIKKAFIKLYKENRIEKITISQLTKEAKVYRGTFYYYYKDIYDLLEQIEGRFFKEVIEDVFGVIEGILSGDIEKRAVEITDHFKKYEEIMTLFFVDKPNYILIRRLKEAAKSKILMILGINNNNLSNEDKYILEYISSAQVGIITKWIENKRDIDTVKLARIIKKVNLLGPVTSLKNNSINK